MKKLRFFGLLGLTAALILGTIIAGCSLFRDDSSGDEYIDITRSAVITLGNGDIVPCELILSSSAKVVDEIDIKDANSFLLREFYTHGKIHDGSVKTTTSGTTTTIVFTYDSGKTFTGSYTSDGVITVDEMPYNGETVSLVTTGKSTPGDLMVTYPGSNLTGSPSTAEKGKTLSATLKPSSGYIPPTEITVKMGGQPLTSSDFTYNKLTGAVSITTNVTGNVSISGDAILVAKSVKDVEIGTIVLGEKTATIPVSGNVKYNDNIFTDPGLSTLAADFADELDGTSKKPKVVNDVTDGKFTWMTVDFANILAHLGSTLSATNKTYDINQTNPALEIYWKKQGEEEIDHLRGITQSASSPYKYSKISITNYTIGTPGKFDNNPFDFLLVPNTSSTSSPITLEIKDGTTTILTITINVGTLTIDAPTS